MFIDTGGSIMDIDFYKKELNNLSNEEKIDYIKNVPDDELKS